MTEYLLCGGNDRVNESFGERLDTEISQRVTAPRILSCFFSCPVDMWERKAASWSKWFQENVPESSGFELASLEDFEEQVKRADVIFFHGGENLRLIEVMSGYPEAERWFDGKVVIGTSAGANWLSRMFYSRSLQDWVQGSGIVDVPLIAHYESNNWSDFITDFEEAERRFSLEHRSEEEIVKLREGEIATFHK